jgi:SAM-dependent methyltransferase
MTGRIASMVDADRQPHPGPVGYDAELQRHNEALQQACGIQFRDQVLDIGCGTGQTTRQAARAARAGSAFGVDASAPAIERARELARAEELRNVAFERADAQVYRFPQDHFDVAISRFGTMFFGDPAAAFANIRRGLRPAGRLVMMVWQAARLNEWDVAICQALGEPQGPAAGAPSGTDPFSLADPPVVKKLLESAGLADVTFTDICEPVYYGPDVPAALDWVSGFMCTSDALERLHPSASARALRRLREVLTAHLGENGVWFDSRAWIVTARPR